MGLSFPSLEIGGRDKNSIYCASLCTIHNGGYFIDIGFGLSRKMMFSSLSLYVETVYIILYIYCAYIYIYTHTHISI